MAHKVPVILCTDRTRRADRRRLERGLIEQLSQRSDVELRVLPHVYDLPPDGPGMARLQSISGDMVVLAWLYPRATFWVLDANEVRGRLGATGSEQEEAGPAATAAESANLADRTLWCFDLRTHEQPEPFVEEIRRVVEAAAARGGEETETASSAVDGPSEIEEAARSRWYPVVDFERCTNCLECLNFCLFGVYGVDASGTITAEQPDACRAGCPACARICPAGAIMFPEHRDAAIAGDPAASPQALKLDLSQLFGGADPAQLAAAERDRALAERAREKDRSPTGEAAEPAPQDDLDRLVDEVDELDL